MFRPLLLGLAAMDCLTFRSLLARETLGAVSVRVAISLAVLEIVLVVPSLEAHNTLRTDFFGLGSVAEVGIIWDLSQLVALAATDCLMFVAPLLAHESLGAVSVRVAISLTVLEILLVVPSLEAKIAVCAVLALDLVCNTVEAVSVSFPSLSALS